MKVIVYIIVVITGILANIIASWVEPSLSNNRRIVIAIFTSFIVFLFFYQNTNETITKNKDSSIDTSTMKVPKSYFLNHIVQENESVYFLAIKYKTTPEELQKLNPTVISKSKNGEWQIRARYQIKVEIKN